MSTSGSATRGTSITSENIVDWGGAKELGRDNYYITEESAPASSALARLALQLDGDNLRNAFLNSPWVKAVIPIRIGKEHQALNWLQQAHVEGSEGLTRPTSPRRTTLPSCSRRLGNGDDPQGARFPESARSRNSTRTRVRRSSAIRPIRKMQQPFRRQPADRAVFEHGFYPLKGGVHFDQEGTQQAIFSQWMEMLGDQFTPVTRRRLNNLGHQQNAVSMIQGIPSVVSVTLQ